MADLRQIQRKLASTRDLREIVAAMRNLAGIYVRRAENALNAMRPYARTVETALGAVLERAGMGAVPTDGEPPAVMALVFAADQGLCGVYNDRAVRAAVQFCDETPGRVDIIAVGRRGRELLDMRGHTPAMELPAPTSLEGIQSQVPEMAADVYDAYCERRAGRMVFVYNAYEGMGRFAPTVQNVLPPTAESLNGGGEERPAFRSDPILSASPAELIPRLAEEYFFVQLYRALLESHASENGARLLSMTAASTNIDTALVDLTKEFQFVRQDAITAELLDVVGGAEALASAG